MSTSTNPTTTNSSNIIKSFHTFFLSEINGNLDNINMLSEQFTITELAEKFHLYCVHELQQDLTIDETLLFDLIFDESARIINVEDRLVNKEQLWEIVKDTHFIGDKTKLTSRAIKEIATMTHSITSSKLKFIKNELTAKELTQLYYIAKVLEQPHWNDFLVLDQHQLVIENQLFTRFPQCCSRFKSMRRINSKINQQYMNMIPQHCTGEVAFIGMPNVQILASLIAGCPIQFQNSNHHHLDDDDDDVILYGDLERLLSATTTTATTSSELNGNSLYATSNNFIIMCWIPTSLHHLCTVVDVGSSTSTPITTSSSIPMDSSIDHSNNNLLVTAEMILGRVLSRKTGVQRQGIQFLDLNKMIVMKDVRAVCMLLLVEF
jgi:hypothetical protein